MWKGVDIKFVITTLLLIAGVINAAPIIGVTSVVQLQALYGIDALGPNLEILLRHRAVMLGLLGAFIIYAAFKPSLQWLAIAMGLSSKLMFIVLTYGLVGDFNESIANVARIDVASSAALIMATILKALRAGRE